MGKLVVKGLTKLIISLHLRFPLSFFRVHSKILMTIFNSIKGTQREKSPSNKTLALTKSMNMDIWVIGTSKQVFIRGS